MGERRSRSRSIVRPLSRLLLSCLALTAAFALGAAQENAGMTIPASLLDCYANATLLSRAGLPTFGITQLIDLIRKVESYPYTRLDLKNMAVQLTQRFRQDGVRRDPRTLASSGVIPYTPSGPEFFRHMILLSKLIPGNAYNFPNSSLTTAEQCTLHFMLSTTVDDIQRNDEDTTCSNLRNYETDAYGSATGGSSGSYYSGGRGGGGGGYSSGVNYNSRRYPAAPTRGPRRTRDASPGIETDVEILDPTLQAEVAKQTKASMSNYLHSRCPIQSGVVFTPWGAVSAGTVIAGIAAGLVPQTVLGESLAAAMPRSRYYTPRRNPGLSSDTMGSIDNKWAATFSGDLAQVALLQGPTSGDRMAVGLAGGWPSTVEPKYYYLTQLSEGAMTDPNIRGSIDGIILASYVNEWYSRTGSALKLSQILDMYYSERGVFDRNTRACARRERYGDVAPTQTLDSQTEAFSKFFGRNNPISVTITDDIISDFSRMAVAKLQNYIPSSLNDPACALGATELLARPYVDLFVVMDAGWQFDYIHPAISFLLDKVEATPYGSRVMLINAKDGSILFNSTYPRLDWHVAYTRDVHERQTAKGFDSSMAIGAAMVQLRQRDLESSRRRMAAGRGAAVLLLPLGPIDQNGIYDRLINFRQLYPDVDMLVLTQGNKNSFGAVSNNTDRDVFLLSPSDPANSILPLVERIKAVPRRVRNPNCDPDWSETTSGNTDFVDYVEPMGVNYYRIAPNNFFRTTDEQAKVRVWSQSQGQGSLTVCYSRTMPAMNGTTNTMASKAQDAGTCSQVSSNGLEIRLTNLCQNAYYVKDCQPVYIAVSATQSQAGGSSARCQEEACRFPDMLKFSMSVERVGCWSAASGLQAAGVLATLFMSLSLRLVRW